MINFDNVTLRRGVSDLLTGVNTTIHAGQRVGVTGRNGTGKSSLFAMVQGDLAPDRGEVDVPRNLAVATVRQETPSGTRGAIEYVLDGDEELRELETRLVKAEAEHDADTQAHIHERLNAIGGYAARARAARLLDGLGFAPSSVDAAIDSFSGGWRMRLNLGRALMCRSDLLLLDEPTNHLDLDAVLWLQDYLSRYQGTLLAISHDRDFLDAVVTHVLHLEQGGATLYSGNYTAFEVRRAERLAQQQSAYENQQKQLAHMQQFVDRFRAKATKARQAQSRIKQMERMQTVAPAHQDNPFTFEFATPERLPTWLLRLDEAAVGYEQTPLLSDIKLTLAPGDRIALLGPNGAGKSTVMRLLAGAKSALSGEQQRDRYLRVGYFAQHQLEQLDVEASPLAHLQRLDPTAREQDLRGFLGGFDFRGDNALTAIAPFSGGEKARLALALVVYQQPNLLLLDEPTNHLDLDMRHALEMALQAFEGAVVLVSHDRHLVDSVCDQLWRVANGRCEPFDGDLDQYARWLRSQREGAQDNSGEAQKQRVSARDNRKAAAEIRQRQKPLRNALKRMEKDMAQLESELGNVESQLADPDLYTGENGDAAALTRKQGELRKKLSGVEEEWLTTAEQLEASGTV